MGIKRSPVVSAPIGVGVDVDDGGSSTEPESERSSATKVAEDSLGCFPVWFTGSMAEASHFTDSILDIWSGGAGIKKGPYEGPVWPRRWSSTVVFTICCTEFDSGAGWCRLGLNQSIVHIEGAEHLVNVVLLGQIDASILSVSGDLESQTKFWFTEIFHVETLFHLLEDVIAMTTGGYKHIVHYECNRGVLVRSASDIEAWVNVRWRESYLTKMLIHFVPEETGCVFQTIEALAEFQNVAFGNTGVSFWRMHIYVLDERSTEESCDNVKLSKI